MGEKVRVLDFRRNTGKWAEGSVVRVLGPVTYQIDIGDQVWKRHIDQIRYKRHIDNGSVYHDQTDMPDLESFKWNQLE